MQNTKFNLKDVVGLIGVIIIVGLVVLFTGDRQEVSGEFAVSGAKVYGGAAVDAGFVAPAAKVYGGAIYRLHPSQFASGKAFILSQDKKPARTYSDQVALETICPSGYDRVRIEDALKFEELGYDVILPGGNIGMNRFACKSKKLEVEKNG